MLVYDRRTDTYRMKRSACFSPVSSSPLTCRPSLRQPAAGSVTAGERPEVHLSAARWLEQAPAHSFEAWRARKVKRGRDPAKGASVSGRI